MTNVPKNFFVTRFSARESGYEKDTDDALLILDADDVLDAEVPVFVVHAESATHRRSDVAKERMASVYAPRTVHTAFYEVSCP